MTEQEQLSNIIVCFDRIQLETDTTHVNEFKSLTDEQKEMIMEYLSNTRDAIVHAKSVIRAALYNVEQPNAG